MQCTIGRCSCTDCATQRTGQEVKRGIAHFRSRPLICINEQQTFGTVVGLLIGAFIPPQISAYRAQLSIDPSRFILTKACIGVSIDRNPTAIEQLIEIDLGCLLAACQGLFVNINLQISAQLCHVVFGQQRGIALIGFQQVVTAMVCTFKTDQFPGLLCCAFLSVFFTHFITLLRRVITQEVVLGGVLGDPRGFLQRALRHRICRSEGV
ncbi:hypothetical protein ASF84_15005 [Pseudomonas sp. Leaf127]|nr:hypothetical protein ASF84_15005 [Pseudomonas sp. Leaf127]